MFPWMTKKNNSPAEELLQDVKRVLFPPLITEHSTDMDGSFKYQVDTSLDNNLDAVLTDLEEGINDENVREQIRIAISKLLHLRKLLGCDMVVDRDAKYVIIGTEKGVKSYENIIPEENF